MHLLRNFLKYWTIFYKRTKDKLIITDPFGVTQKTRQRERQIKRKRERKCIYFMGFVSAMQKLRGRRGERLKGIIFNSKGSDMSLRR